MSFQKLHFGEICVIMNVITKHYRQREPKIKTKTYAKSNIRHCGGRRRIAFCCIAHFEPVQRDDERRADQFALGITAGRA